ncbi:MAG: LOG family protein [Helicobacter sp.]|nr:LOG family protein [Helicobacter sp.]
MEQIWLQNLDEIHKVKDLVRMRAGGAQKQAVVVFGSARIRADSQSYAEALGVSTELAQRGYFIVTGGGYGIMEAANRGAKDGGALSVGLNISLPHEEIPNSYLDVSVQFHDFWLRKMFFEHILIIPATARNVYVRTERRNIDAALWKMGIVRAEHKPLKSVLGVWGLLRGLFRN